MKSAILTEINKPLEIWDVEPEKLDYGQVLIKIISSGLCGAQLQEISGLKGNSGFVPHLLGHEGCALVEETGSGVSKVRKGDKVIVHWRKSSGIESKFPTYAYKNKKISGGKATTLSEFSIVSENRVTKVNESVDEDFCTLLGCGLSTGLSVANKQGNIKLGESVLILGGGGVGICAAIGAALSRASEIYVVEKNKSKKQLIESFDLNFNFLHYEDLSTFFSFGKKIDCIIDTTGYLPLVSECVPHLSDNGRCILIAQPIKGSKLEIHDPINFFTGEGITISTSQAGGFNPETDVARYINLYDSNKSILKDCIDKLITHRYDLSDINKALECLTTKPTGRIIINP